MARVVVTDEWPRMRAISSAGMFICSRNDLQRFVVEADGGGGEADQVVFDTGLAGGRKQVPRPLASKAGSEADWSAAGWPSVRGARVTAIPRLPCWPGIEHARIEPERPAINNLSRPGGADAIFTGTWQGDQIRLLPSPS